MSVVETGSPEPSEPLSPGDAMQNSARPADCHGLLKHSCEFLDFWDIAKPEQETRFAATKLLEYLRARPQMERRVHGVCSFLSPFNARVRLVPQESEVKYALKRLITGLGVGRETARPCYSLALAQVRWCSWQDPSHAGENGGV
ncbi:Myb-binding protein 1A [Saguinus oedipus]|uniref:Myb-binding protein 1A n=1 Tax=Saguinus oedipus TaxID=9490 RepID=A0ABQ9V7C2_SAGOE|nr:Myb-binding protein 1A [Saguinus oedipus]